MMFLQIDTNSRLAGYRAGSYEPEDIAPGEVNAPEGFTSGDFRTNQFCIYDPETGLFTKDQTAIDLQDQRDNPPPPPFSYDNAWSNIKAIRDRKTQRGGYKVAQNWFHSDTFSRTQQLGLVMMGAAMPTGLQWKTMNGSFIEMTPTLAQQIFAAAGQQDSALFTYAEQLHAQVQSAQDPATVDLEAGWPETFENV
jgi:hypothetical protein